MSGKITAIALLFITFSCQIGFGQDNSTVLLNEKIDQFVKAEKDRLKIPGLSLVILRDGKVVKENHLGFADLELKTPVNEHSAFSIASMSKTYTATAILLLAEREKLNLDDGIRKYLPEAPATWQTITLRQLISHTSGLADDWSLHDDWENTHKSIFATADSNEIFLKALYKTPLHFEPGTSVRYGCGTFVLGVVIEKVSGKNYSQFMHEEMFEPLGLKETWVDDPLKIIPHRVSGYVFENKKLQNGYKVSATTLARGDISIRTSARDIAKWFRALRGGKLLDQNSLKLMYERAKTTDGLIVPPSLGWIIYQLRGSTTVEHTGNYRTGFSSIIIEFVEDDLTIILLLNLADAEPFSFARKIAAIYNPDYRYIKDLPVQPEPKNAPTKQFEKVIKALALGKTDGKVMSENFPVLYFGGDRKKFFEKVTTIDFLSRRDISEMKIKIFGTPVKELWFYRLNGEKPAYTAFYMDKDRKVIFLDDPEN